nr:ATP-binding protein [Kitasatospora sp. SID7827]
MAVQADPAEVSRARRWVRDRLRAAGIDQDSAVAETLVLVVSELVTNAVVHTGSPAVLRLLVPADPAAVPPAVRVEVADASRTAPAPRHAGADQDATNGRGLELVELLCERWGWYPEGSGKRVWCEIGDPDGAVGALAARPAASAAPVASPVPAR